MVVVWEVRAMVVGGLGTVRGRGRRRWQVEVKAEQFSAVGVEVCRGMGGQGWGQTGIMVVKVTVNYSGPGPTTLQDSLAFVILSMKSLSGVFSRDKCENYKVLQVIGSFSLKIQARKGGWEGLGGARPE